MKIHTFLAATALATCATITAASAQEACRIDVDDPYDLDEAGVTALYDCIEGKLAEAYASGDSEIGAQYRDWTVAATLPALAGTHGDRFVQTYANEIAAEQYLKFEEDGVVMPAGSILAKESYKVGKDGAANPGPLFTMVKLEAGASPDTADWEYGGVQPNGKPMGIKQSFCHDCHGAYDSQDALAYPLEDLRVSN